MYYDNKVQKIGVDVWIHIEPNYIILQRYNYTDLLNHAIRVCTVFVK